MHNLLSLTHNLNLLVHYSHLKPEEIVSKINLLGKRTSDVETIKSIIVDLCALKALQGKEIASILGKSDRYIFRKFLKPLLEEKRLEYTVPDMINHPEQAYKAIKDKLIT